MSRDDLSYSGTLVDSGKSLSVRVRIASRYSLWLRFVGREPRIVEKRFEKFKLQLEERTVEMGPCDLRSDIGGLDGELRLIPLRSITDFEKLLFRSRVSILESAALNLPLILSYKNSIDTDFSLFVSDLTYDLSAFRATLDEIDENIADEPEPVRSAIRSGIIESVGGDLMEVLEKKHKTLIRITENWTEKQHEHHGYFFRRQLWSIILSSPIMTRTNTKPRGYIGDSEMMHMIYLNDYQGASTFGQILHKYSVDQPAAQAVRNRRKDLSEILRRFMDGWEPQESQGGKDAMRVLSVACGPAMELSDIIKTREDCFRLHFSLLDQDPHALEEAASVVESIEKKLDRPISVDFLKESVRTMLVTRELQDRWGRFDFIYSMGLFDYLTPPVAKAVIKKLYNLLLPGGEMIIGNFSVDNPTKTYMAYWMDWSIIYRSREEMYALGDDLPGAHTEVGVDATGIQLFLRINKAKAE